MDEEEKKAEDEEAKSGIEIIVDEDDLEKSPQEKLMDEFELEEKYAEIIGSAIEEYIREKISESTKDWSEEVEQRIINHLSTFYIEMAKELDSVSDSVATERSSLKENGRWKATVTILIHEIDHIIREDMESEPEEKIEDLKALLYDWILGNDLAFDTVETISQEELEELLKEFKEDDNFGA